MEKIRDGQYSVAPEEVITVRVETFTTADLGTASVDNGPANQVSKDPTRFEITANKTSGFIHRFLFIAAFAPGTPAAAKYVLHPQGSLGDTQEYSEPAIKATSKLLARVTTFIVK